MAAAPKNEWSGPRKDLELLDGDEHEKYQDLA
jgi:hypothetical protein